MRGQYRPYRQTAWRLCKPPVTLAHCGISVGTYGSYPVQKVDMRGGHGTLSVAQARRMIKAATAKPR